MILAICNFIKKDKFTQNFYLEVAVSVCAEEVVGDVVALLGGEVAVTWV